MHAYVHYVSYRCMCLSMFYLFMYLLFVYAFIYAFISSFILSISFILIIFICHGYIYWYIGIVAIVTSIEHGVRKWHVDLFFGRLHAPADAQLTRRRGLACKAGARIRGTLGDIDPLNKVPFKRAISRAQQGPL